MTTLTLNQELNGIEISFDCKPVAATLNALKGIGFRWHSKRRVWYAKNTPERLELAQTIAETDDYAQKIIAEEAPIEKPRKAAVNKFGIKVGDVFYEDWGYEQTNIDFWQVTELRGSTQIVLKAISHEVARQDGFCSCYVKPKKDCFTKHYPGEELRRTVKGNAEHYYCNSKHGNLYPTTWDTEHLETSYY